MIIAKKIKVDLPANYKEPLSGYEIQMLKREKAMNPKADPKYIEHVIRMKRVK